MLAGQQSRGLHGQRRRARYETAIADELPTRTQSREIIDPRVSAEPAILEREQHVEVALIDIFNGNRKAPYAIARRERAQKAVLAIEYNGRELARAIERGNRQPACQHFECDKRSYEKCRNGDCREKSSLCNGAAGSRLRRLTAAPGRPTRWRLPHLNPCRCRFRPDTSKCSSHGGEKVARDAFSDLERRRRLHVRIARIAVHHNLFAISG